MLGDVRRGLILYGLHALSALLTGLLLPGSAPPAALRTARREKPVLSSLLPEAVQGSCAALLQVSGLIVFFSSMLAVLRAAGLTALLPNRLAEALACGALELSSGRAGPRLLCAVSCRAAVCRSVDRLRTAGSPAAKNSGWKFAPRCGIIAKKEVARMLFRKKIDRFCSYCVYAGKLDDETYLCAKRGFVAACHHCRKFKYDPLKRVPKRRSIW